MIDIINSRRSVRKFKADPISEQDLKDILEAAMNAPSAGNEQAWQFVVLQGEMFQKYQAVNPNCPKGAPVGILVCQDTRAEKYAGYAVQDCSAATQNILLAAHFKGLGSVWTTVFPQNAAGTRQLLNLPDQITPFACIPIGYPAVTPDKPTSRYDAARVHQNAW
jgi:nitroreductase